MITRDEFLSWERRQPGRFELHHGFIIAFAGGTKNHDLIGFNVRTILQRAFEAPCQTFGSDVKIEVAEATIYYADAGVDCTPFDGGATFVTSPRVVCEVLSPSTRTYDLVEKRHAYRAMASIELYLVVHTDARRIEIDRRASAGWQTSIIDADSFPLGSTRATLDEVYRGSTVP